MASDWNDLHNLLFYHKISEFRDIVLSFGWQSARLKTGKDQILGVIIDQNIDQNFNPKKWQKLSDFRILNDQILILFEMFDFEKLWIANLYDSDRLLSTFYKNFFFRRNWCLSFEVLFRFYDLWKIPVFRLSFFVHF